MTRAHLTIPALFLLASAHCTTVCEEIEVEQPFGFRLSELTKVGTGFRLADGRTYESCTAFCEELDGVIEHLGCEGPNKEADASFNPTTSRRETGWGVHCKMAVASCTTPSGGRLDCGKGRCPASTPLFASKYMPPDSAGSYFAHAAAAEQVSVYEFYRLARELQAFAAPEELVRECLEASLDEVEHAEAMRALTKRAGGSSMRFLLPDSSSRTLEEVALANAVDGCVGEGVGAEILSLQAVRTVDPEIRHALTKIACDERKHGALSKELHLWFMAKLDPGAQSRVTAAMDNARRRLDPTGLAERANNSVPWLGRIEPGDVERICRDHAAGYLS